MSSDRGKSVCERADSDSYHGLHRLPALGLRSRQEEILGISPEIHLQVDVEVHGVACLRFNAYYTRQTRSVVADQLRLFGLISPIQSTVIYPTGGMRRILCLHQRSGHAHRAPRVRKSERHFRYYVTAQKGSVSDAEEKDHPRTAEHQQ